MISYAKKAIPETYTILGLTLKPFSLGHYLLMERFDCAFSDPNPDTMMSVNDFVLALCICSRTYEGFLDFVDNPKQMEKWTKKWGKAVLKRMKKDKEFNLLYKILLFKKYMKEGTELPKYWIEDDEKEGKTGGGHWTQSVLLTLVSECNMTESQVLNQPLSKSFADYLKFCETYGSVTLFTEEELEEVGVE